MTLRSLSIQSLIHYWRTNLATTLGLAIAAAVLAGGMLVGDSVRGSLHDLAFSRLGATDHAIIGNGFFREDLANGAPLIALEAVVTHDDSSRRASKVAVYAVDERFFRFHGRAQNPPQAGDALLSPALARELLANPGDSILIRIPRISAVPTESLHGNKDDPGRTLRSRMREVIARNAMGEFALSPSQGDVHAVFLPLARLQREFELNGRVNTLLLKQPVDLKTIYRLEDIGVRTNGPRIEHESLILNDELVRAVKAVDPGAQPAYAYLANTIRANGREVPYSLVAAIDRPDLPDNNSIVLNEWAARDMRAKPGDTVELDYYLWDPSGRLITRSATFRLAAVTPVNEADKDLAPEYPGISGAASVADWDPPFPMELGRIRQQDEDYWDRYRATPKAYIRLASGQNLWRSRYGAVTSIRTSPGFDTNRLRQAVDPGQAGLTLLNARAQAQQSSRGSTDFGEYFGYFSFFLLVSALLLAGLFFRFGLEQRAAEIATLRAVGFSGGALRKLYLTEALALGFAGGVLAILGALLYGVLILTGLQTWWIDAVGTRELSLHVSPSAILLPLIAGLIIGPVVVWFSLRSMLRLAPRQTTPARTRKRSTWLAIAALLGGIALLFAGGPGGFFAAGALLLTAALIFLLRTLRATPGNAGTLAALGIRYTAHRPGRSVLCVALIASATFLIVAVDAFRRDAKTSEGPWRLFAESSIPLYHDPNTAEGREALNVGNVPEAKWLAFRLRPGDDASCLNLYAPRNPRVLGVPESFLKLDSGTAAVDATTLQYVLHKKVGDTIEVGGTTFTIARTLSDTVFQSEVLISDADFQRAYPDEGGHRVFLIDAPEANAGELEEALAGYGLDIVPVAARIASFHRVENTWLSTFQALGALGLILGTIGLGAVLLRNMLERRREFGLLRAVGYGQSHLSRVTIAENLFLLLTGLAIGTVCALIAVLPTVLARGGSVPFGSIAAVLLAVLAAGLASTAVAARIATRAPVLDALRSE